eukprot:1088565-Rhodomonas_salina.7
MSFGSGVAGERVCARICEAGETQGHLVDNTESKQANMSTCRLLHGCWAQLRECQLGCSVGCV